MRESVPQFFSCLHRERLKALGYKKTKYTFAREMNGYIERAQFQGSSWNDSERHWRFYINFGVEFPDLPPRMPCRDFPSTHCWTRVEQIVPDAPKHFEMTDIRTEEFAAEIAAYLDRASKAVDRQIENIRANYQRTHSSRLITAV